jgi:asparagine N-glycosylation enzyme membrane subunit Stt3
MQEEDKLMQERQKKFFSFLKKKPSSIYYLILAVIVYIGIYIRTIPMKINPATGKPGLWDIARDSWTLGPDLDPFLFLRYAKEIILNGKIMAIDFMRYVPVGYPTKEELLLHPYLIASLHKFLSIFGNPSVEYSAIIYPVIMFALTTIAFFFLARKVFLHKLGKNKSTIIALISSLLLTLIPSLLPRTIAGIPEKESAAFLFLFLALYFFLSAWLSKTRKTGVIFAILSGVATAGMALIWGGSGYIFLILSFTVLVAFLLGKTNKKEVIFYAIWLVTSFGLMTPFSVRHSLKNLVSGLNTGSCVFVLAIMVLHLIIMNTKLKKYYKTKIGSKIPAEINTLIIGVILTIILSSAIFGLSFVPGKVSEISQNLIKPAQSRLINTVAENRQPYFSEWANSFGPTINGFPVLFWMFFVGSIYLFYKIIFMLEKNKKQILTIAFTYFLIAIIFSRYSAKSLMNGSNAASLLFYASGFIVLIGVFGYYFYKTYLAGKLYLLKKIDISFLLLMVFIFLGIISARGAVRVIMMLVAPLSMVVSFLIVDITQKAIKKKKQVGYWILSIVLIILLIFALFFPGKGLYYVSVGTASAYIPSPYNQQWQNAMSWVRENTAENAVFGHWWDYGYWVQSIGERATMLDGGNAVGYWNYLMGRHVLTGESQEEAMNVLYGHNVTHFLIDATDIGKYSAYSSIGSDENSDRFSWIGTFLMDERQTQETKETETYVYPGGIAFDEDILIKNNNKDLLLPRLRTGVGAIIIQKDKSGEYLQPEIISVYNRVQYKLPLRYLFLEGELIDFGNEKENTLEAGAFVFPRITSDSRLNTIGAALYLSPKNMKTVWVNLYLLEKEDNFKLVHTEPSSVHTQYLIPNNVQVGDFVYFRGIQGPIKIWEINYPLNQKSYPEYIQEEFPEELLSRK